MIVETVCDNCGLVSHFESAIASKRPALVLHCANCRRPITLPCERTRCIACGVVMSGNWAHRVDCPLLAINRLTY